MTNRERAEELVGTFGHAYPHEFVGDTAACYICQTFIDIIADRLDEAEMRGRDGAAVLHSMAEVAEVRQLTGEIAKANAILDKVIEMDGCIVCYGDSKSVLGGECQTCNGTGLGPIARYVREARNG